MAIRKHRRAKFLETKDIQNEILKWNQMNLFLPSVLVSLILQYILLLNIRKQKFYSKLSEFNQSYREHGCVFDQPIIEFKSEQKIANLSRWIIPRWRWSQSVIVQVYHGQIMGIYGLPLNLSLLTMPKKLSLCWKETFFQAKGETNQIVSLFDHLSVDKEQELLPIFQFQRQPYGTDALESGNFWWVVLSQRKTEKTRARKLNQIKTFLYVFKKPLRGETNAELFASFRLPSLPRLDATVFLNIQANSLIVHADNYLVFYSLYNELKMDLFIKS